MPALRGIEPTRRAIWAPSKATLASSVRRVAGEQREGAVVELHAHALERAHGRRDLEQLQVHGLVGAEQGAAGDAEEEGVADLAGSAGHGNLHGCSHGLGPYSFPHRHRNPDEPGRGDPHPAVLDTPTSGYDLVRVRSHPTKGTRRVHRSWNAHPHHHPPDPHLLRSEAGRQVASASSRPPDAPIPVGAFGASRAPSSAAMATSSWARRGGGS